MAKWHTHNGSVAVVAGVRTPFVKAGAALRDMSMVNLSRVLIQEALHRVGWSGSALDEVILGNVVMPADAANPARVAAVQAGVPLDVPALTVQRNCASGLEAVAQGAWNIHTGKVGSVLVGGAESMSNVPLLFSRETLEPMARLMKAKTLWQNATAVASFRPRHFRPVSAMVQGLTDPLCEMIMGQTAEVLAQEYSISRQDQDEFALRSHRCATEAVEAGRFDEQILPVYVGPRFKPVTEDIGPRREQTMEALAKLRPIFDRRDGTVTVGNACQVTDGAASLLITNGERARADGMEILGHVRGYATAALDPARMGLGPVFAIDQLLSMTDLRLEDIELFEINEAFAAQVLACLKAMGSDRFGREQLGRTGALGEIDIQRLNVNGGAIALGHPVGATGARMVLALLSEMRRRQVRFGVAALCVAGGQGAAMLLERNS